MEKYKFLKQRHLDTATIFALTTALVSLFFLAFLLIRNL